MMHEKKKEKKRKKENEERLKIRNMNQRKT
jgi:hypothetical protein